MRRILIVSLIIGFCGLLLAQNEGIQSDESGSEKKGASANHQQKYISETNITLGDLALEGLDLFAADSFYTIALNNTTTDTEKIKLLLKKGQILRRMSNADRLMTVLEHLSILIEKNNSDDAILYSFYSLYATYYHLHDDFLNELEYWLKAKSIVDPTRQEEVYYLNRVISIIYFRLQDYESSLRLYQEDLSIAQKQRDSMNIMYSYYGVGDSNLQLERLTEVKKVCFKAIELHEKANINKAFGFIYYLLGSVYIQENQLDSALFYAEKGIALSKKQKENKELSDNYIVMCNLMLIEGDTSRAQFYAEQVIAIRGQHDLSINRQLATIYESQNRHLEANALLKKNLDFYDKIKDKNYVFNLASKLLQNKFEQEKKNQIALEKQKFQKRQMNIALIGVLLLFALSIVILIIQLIHKKKVQIINARLMEKNEELQQFAYICSHDLKESIRNIGSFSSLLGAQLEKESLTGKYKDYLQVINTGVSTLTRIVESLKVFIGIEENKQLTKTNVDLIPLLDEVETSLAPSIQERKANIVVNNQLSDPKIYSSKNELFIILQNIIQNSILHNESQNTIVDINISPKNKDVLIAIKDNGPGIPKDYLAYIFKPFKTLKNKSISNSSGLGLTICTKLINQIGGELWVESEMGKGSVFYILLNQ